MLGFYEIEWIAGPRVQRRDDRSCDRVFNLLSRTSSCPLTLTTARHKMSCLTATAESFIHSVESCRNSPISGMTSLVVLQSPSLIFLSSCRLESIQRKPVKMEPARSRCETPRGTDPTFRYIGKRAGSLNKWGELSGLTE
jgi:hypothetical protein